MRTRFCLVVLACSTLSACGIDRALNDHITTVARVGPSTLSADDLTGFFAQSKIAVRPTRESVEFLASLWVSYHELAEAGAHGDSLTDFIDVALTPLFNSERVARYEDSVRTRSAADSASEEGYAAGAAGLYAARHILLRFPDSAATPCSPYPCPSARQRDSVREAARTLATQVTNANFADLAKSRSGDPSSAIHGGELGFFSKDEMVPAFSTATAALKPGEISGPVETPYGVHIIQRHTFPEVEHDYRPIYNQNATARAEREWQDGIAKETGLAVRPNAGTMAKAAVMSIAEHQKDHTTMATFAGGEMTVAEFLSWLRTQPPEARIYETIRDFPDSDITKIVRFVAVQALVLRKADAAHTQLPAEQRQSFRDQFRQAFGQTQQTLGVTPQQLTGRTVSEREQLAVSRVDTAIARIMSGQMQVLQVPGPVRAVLDTKYLTRPSAMAIDRVLTQANARTPQ